MPRQGEDYEVVYVTRPREVVYEIPRRTAPSRDDRNERASDAYERRQRRDYEFRSHISETYIRDGHVIVVDRPNRTEQAGSAAGGRYTRRADDVYDEYYLPSRSVEDPSQSIRRRRSPEDHQRRRRASPEAYEAPRGSRGRRDGRDVTPPRRLRSAMRDSRNESPDTARRLRARSVSFREAEADRHDVGNQKHERPGYEARMIGQYLRHDEDDDLASETYAARRRSRR